LARSSFEEIGVALDFGLAFFELFGQDAVVFFVVVG
jgi:hypothetical protein